MKKLILLTVGVWLVYLAFLPPGIYSLDGNSMLAVAESMVTSHSITVPAALGRPGRRGLVYSTWYPLQSVLAVPPVIAGEVASRALHIPDHYVDAICALILPALYSAVTVAFVYLIAIRLGSKDLGAWIAALTYAFGTMAIVYARTFFAEPLLALLTAASVYFAFEAGDVGTLLIVAALSGLAVLAKPTGIIVGPILSLYLLAKRRPFWWSALPSAGTGLGLGVYCLYNYYRFSGLFQFGPSILTPPLAPSLAYAPSGIAGMLLSPGAGIIWYCPCVILSVVGFWKARTSKRLECLTIAALFAAGVALHCCWFFWNGGWSWGPRYLLPALPGVVALTGLLEGRWRKSLIVLAIAGFVISAPTLVTYYERYFAEATEQNVSLNDVLWQPARSPLLHEWPAAIREIEDAEHFDVKELFRERGSPSATIANSRALRIVAVWWWLLPIVHVTRIIGVAWSMAVGLTGIWKIAQSVPFAIVSEAKIE